MNVRTLDETQTAAFNREYMYPARWKLVREAIERDFPSGKLRVLDIGGGNGMFVDRVLEDFPQATGVVIDNSRELLAENKPNPRKTLIFGSATDLSPLRDERFDLICCNWLLHHLVSDSYSDTIKNIRSALQQAAKLLTPAGRVAIWENLYEGVLIDQFPSRAIYGLTSIKAVAPLVRSLGANTAGVGVCFQSGKQWQSHFSSCGLSVMSKQRDSIFVASRKPSVIRTLLHLKPVGPVFYWLRA